MDEWRHPSTRAVIGEITASGVEVADVGVSVQAASPRNSAATTLEIRRI